MKFILAFACLSSVLAVAQTGPKADQLKNLKFREIGPAVPGGRIDDFAVVENNTNIVYAATAAGGLFKSVNAGISWHPIFDDQSVPTIGDVTVSQSEPDVVWVGSGEGNNRQSSSWGNGVYKSSDAGKTWTNMGLKDTHHIPRIVINPTNANIVYVAAQGHLWGPNEERGVFKTTDGGKTWTKSLYINPDTGVNDIVMDPSNPDTLYAAAYQRRRTAFGMNGGGPGSGIYRTTDGGATWKKLSNGLPKTEMGRIGLDVFRRNSNVVYAVIESEDSGTYRSDDKGENWTRMSNYDPRPMYFSQVRIDPNNDQRIWVAGVNMGYSEDGGKTFKTDVIQRIHVDFHAIWIDPSNSDNMIVGCDGGIHFSHDHGKSWDSRENIAIGQFYEVAYDMAKPYKVCGGLQDNYSFCGPSATLNSRGITNEDWYTVASGDGFYAQIDPEEPWIVYAESQDGNIVRRDLRTHEAKSIRPREEDDKSSRYRFQWNTPMVISKFDRKTIYYGGNYIFKSTNQGDDWKRISPDLTSNVDRKTLSIMGMKVENRHMLSRNDGVANYPTTTTLSESPVRAGILWAGTDDGNVQVSRDGETWKSVSIPGVPKGTYVSRVMASESDPGAAYVAFDGHRSNDFNVYLFKTTDFGATWKTITNGLPQSAGTIHVVREHPRNANLLFAGTEFGLFVSFDRGEHWQEFKNNLPRVPVDDIQIHPRENDLILATHGRSIWILDNISALEKMTANTSSSALESYAVRPAIMWRMKQTRGFDGHDSYVAQNPPHGAIIDFWTATKPDTKDVKIEIKDGSGKHVATVKPAASLDAGVNRTVWNMRTDAPVPPTPQELERAARFAAQGGEENNLGSGPLVDPGQYTAEIAIGANKTSQKFTVEEDPRLTWYSAADRGKRRAAIDELVGMSKQVGGLRKKFTAADTALTGLQNSWKRPDGPKPPENVRQQAASLKKSLDGVRPLFQGRNFFEPPSPEERKAEFEQPEPEFVLPALQQRVSQMTQMLESFSAAPSDSQLKQIELTKVAIADASKRMDALRADVVKFNEAMNAANVPFVPVP